MSLTFVHTSDWHLGRSLRRIGPRAAESSRWRVESVYRCFDLAVKEHASFILAAGDIFNSDSPRPEIVEDAISLFRDAPVPLVVIPGNHDPCAPGSIWHRQDFRARIQGLANLRLVLEPKTLQIGEAEILATPTDSKSRPDDATMWMPPAERGPNYRIGLAHGRHQRYNGQEYFDNFINDHRAEICGLDYLALGDFHSYTLDHFPCAVSRTYYSGTIECTALDEERPGYALLVMIETPGQIPAVQPHVVGHARPHDLGEVRLSPDLGFQALVEKVVAIPDAARTLLGGRITGILTQSQMDKFEPWYAEIGQGFLGAALDRQLLFAEPDDNDFAELSLAPSERRILDHLQGDALLNALGEGTASLVVRAAENADVRRNATALYYQFLREAQG